MKTRVLTLLAGLVFSLVLTVKAPTQVWASQGQVLGMHIMNIYELPPVDQFFQTLSTDKDQNQWRYVTVPFILDDLNKKAEWQQFFYQAEQYHMKPIVRLATRVENGAWQVPTRKEITDMVNLLSQLDWPTDQKIIIVFNEVNHAKEWGGHVDPTSYLDVLQFTSSWAHATDPQFVVLPAAMDLAATQGGETWEAFNYWDKLYALDPEVFSYVDAWNSHSYPNPGFSSSPTGTAKNSIRGFQHELAYVKDKTGKDFQVYITETGWVVNRTTQRWLESYYTYALQNVWSDPRVVAVTPFVFKGDPGPFSGFGFLDRFDKPTLQYAALSRAVQKVQ